MTDQALERIRRRKNQGLESDLEANCMQLIDDLGGTHRKLDVGHLAKGQLDQAIWLPGGVHLVVEFKVGSNVMNPKQRKKYEHLRRMEHNVFVVRTPNDFIAALHQSGFSRIESAALTAFHAAF